MRKIVKILIVILVAGIIAGTLVNVIQAFADTTTSTDDTVVAFQVQGGNWGCGTEASTSNTFTLGNVVDGHRIILHNGEDSIQEVDMYIGGNNSVIVSFHGHSLTPDKSGFHVKGIIYGNMCDQTITAVDIIGSCDGTKFGITSKPVGSLTLTALGDKVQAACI